MKQTDTTAATWQARKARAIAFLKDKPKPGKGWASLRYEYDREEQGNAVRTQEPR